MQDNADPQDHEAGEEKDVNADEDDDEENEEEEDSDEDNVQITIDHGKIEEAKSSYQNFGIKQSTRQLPSEKKGKFNVEDFEQPGTIDGVQVQDIELENIEDKPWRKPG